MATKTRQQAGREDWRVHPGNVIGVRICFSRLMRALSSDQGLPGNLAHTEKMAARLAEALAKHLDAVDVNQEKSS